MGCELVSLSCELVSLSYYFAGLALGMLAGFFFGRAYQLRLEIRNSRTKERWSTLLFPPKWK